MKSKPVILAGNWKMNHGQQETTEFLNRFNLNPKLHATMRLYVPYLCLETALERVQDRNLPLQIGAQNAHFEKSGAFTGEISIPMLREIGVDQLLVGHSERRQFFNETNETVVQKTAAALNAQMEVLVCVGETLVEREKNQTESILLQQIAPLLEHPQIASAFGTTVHIAYEPVWAIGTGKVATPAQAESAHAYLRGLFSKRLNPSQTNATRILYGGSVNPSNFRALLDCPNIDGGLVGGASLKLDSWTQLWALI